MQVINDLLIENTDCLECIHKRVLNETQKYCDCLGIGAVNATGLSLLKVNKDLVIRSTVVVGAGLMIALKDKEDLNLSDLELSSEEVVELGKDQLKIGKVEWAIKSFTKSIDVSPLDADKYFWRGCVYENLEEFEKAIPDLSKAIELDPTNSEPLSILQDLISFSF